MNEKPHVIIIGGGFGGLYAARAFKREDVDVTLIDKRNFHLFQPLLYQVATGGLSPGDISSPLRAIFKNQKNVRVILGEMTGFDPNKKEVYLRDETLSYDYLIIATGVRHSYFGHDQWENLAPGIKTIEDATNMRHRIFLAFEAAEREPDPERRKAWLNFILVGAGPTGVELAGALAELANHTLRENFRSIDPADARIYLVEGTGRVLPQYAPELSVRARRSLERLNVTVLTETLVTQINPNTVILKTKDKESPLPTKTVLWAAGIQASPLGKIIGEATGATLDRAGRVIVEPDLSVNGHPELFVIGDLANFSHQNGSPLPGIAPVAMQQGRYVAKRIQSLIEEKPSKPFHYNDRGNMAVIGRAAAVADLRIIRFSGYPAWLIWLFVHIMYLVEYENRILVLVQWSWNYITRNTGARLITGLDRIELIEKPGDSNDNEAAKRIHES